MEVKKTCRTDSKMRHCSSVCVSHTNSAHTNPFKVRQPCSRIKPHRARYGIASRLFALRKRKQVRCEFALGRVTPLKHTSATERDAKSHRHANALGVAGPEVSGRSNFAGNRTVLYLTAIACFCEPRNQAMGISSVGGRLGNMLAPFSSYVVGFFFTTE